MKKLVVISHTRHYLQNGKAVGWGPTVREIDYLAQLFSEIIHIAPLHDDSPPAGMVTYCSDRIRLRPVKPSGGTRLHEKLRILRHYPSYFGVIREELKSA